MYNEDKFCVTLDVNANIIDFGGKASSISGFSASDVLGKNWFEVFIPEKDLDGILTVFKGFLNGDLSFWEHKNEITCKDGSKCLIQWKNTLRRDPDNNPIAVYSEGSLV